MTQKPNLFSIEVNDLKGRKIPLADYKGKVLLIVNTASACGYTPQFKNLEALYNRYKDSGFEILAFPSNDFGAQEPLAGNSIQEFCESKYQTSFRIFEKIHVKGANQHPLYKFLSKGKLNGVKSMTPKWNFHKYLINKKGEYVDYYFSFTDPLSGRICRKIKKLLQEI